MARMASMRVNSCATQFKECLQSEDLCGPDYTQCIGLDTDTIVQMCPYDSLVGCQQEYGETSIRDDAVYDELYNIAQGIFLNIDNNLLEECQNIANEAMIAVCGDTDDCTNLTVDDNIGARSLDYKICEYSVTGTGNNAKVYYNAAACMADASVISDADLRENRALAGILSGMIFWENVEFDENGNLDDIDTYLNKSGLTVNDSERQLIKSELGTLQQNINNAIDIIESDPNVQFCLNGRTVQGVNDRNVVDRSSSGGRFPNLTKQIRMTIADAALKKARENYYAEYDTRIDKMYKDFKEIGERMGELAEEDQLNARREAARVACINLAYASTAEMSPVASAIGASNSVASTVVNQGTMIMPYTSGQSDLASAQELQDAIADLQMTGTSRSRNLTLIRDVNTTFNWDSLVCKKCIRTQTCAKVRKPLFRSKYCKTWNEAVETCEDIQF